MKKIVALIMVLAMMLSVTAFAEPTAIEFGDENTLEEADAVVIASLMDVCWLMNLRGADVACTPVVLSFAAVTAEEAVLFVNPAVLSDEIRAGLAADGVTLRPYGDVYAYLAALPAGQRLMMDLRVVNSRMLDSVPDGVTGNTLHVEMVVGVYTPEKPVYQMEGFDAAAIQQKWDEGYYVIVDGDGMIFYDEEEQRLVQGFPGRVLDYEEQGLLRSEMTVSFDLDLKAARASVRHPDLPAPLTKDSTTLAVQSLAVSPLQTHIVATFTPDNASYEDIVAWCQKADLAFYDGEGNRMNHGDICLMPQYEATVEEAPDGTWFRQLDCNLIEVDESLPDTIYLVYETKDGFRMELPVTIK